MTNNAEEIKIKQIYSNKFENLNDIISQKNVVIRINLSRNRKPKQSNFNKINEKVIKKPSHEDLQMYRWREREEKQMKINGAKC